MNLQTFSPESKYLDGLLERRDETVKQRVPFGISFLDDCFGGLYPRDLVLLGADTGVGKTGVAVAVARAGVRAGRAVCLFALEAEPGEVTARLVYDELGKRVKHTRLDFAGWWRGQWAEEDRKHWKAIQAKLKPELDRLQTFYKPRGDFTAKDLAKQLEAIANTTEMVVLDHIHEVDADARGDREAERRTVGLLRDLAFHQDIPVVAVAQMNKPDKFERNLLMRDKSDLHGHSDIVKKATGIVIIARDWNGHRPAPHLAPTFMKVDKDRRGRASPLVARIYYDMSVGKYQDDYTLGRIVWRDRKQQWEPLPPEQVPSWARRGHEEILF